MTQRPTIDSQFPWFLRQASQGGEQDDLSVMLAHIPKMVRATLAQTRELASTLERRTVTETCFYTWAFCRRFFKNGRDEGGLVRSPRISWHERETGIGQGSFATLVSSVLTNLGIPHKLRVTKHIDHANPFQPAKAIPFSHIQVVALDGDREVGIDPSAEQFGHEAPMLAKRDFKMDMESFSGPPRSSVCTIDSLDLGLVNSPILSGTGPSKPPSTNASVDRIDLGLVGFPLTRDRRHQQGTPAISGMWPNPERTEIRAHAINRANPEAILLRTGILAGIRLDILGIRTSLRHAYLTEAEALSFSLDLARLAHLRKARERLERLVYVAGGNPGSLKGAVLQDVSHREHHTANAAIEAAKPAIEVVAAFIASIGFGSPGTPAPGSLHVQNLLGRTQHCKGKTQGWPLNAPTVTDTTFLADEHGCKHLEGILGQPATSEPPGENGFADVQNPKMPSKQSSNQGKGVGEWVKNDPILAFAVIPVAAIAIGVAILVKLRKPNMARYSIEDQAQLLNSTG